MHDDITSSFRISRQKEFAELMARKVFFIVPRQIARGFRIYESRFVNEIKNIGTPEAFEKSRLVVQTFNDNADIFIVYAPTIQQISEILLLCIAPCNEVMHTCNQRILYPENIY